MENNFFNDIYYNLLCYSLIPLLIGVTGVLVFVLKKISLKVLMLLLFLFLLCEETSFAFNIAGLFNYGSVNEEFFLKTSAKLALIPYERGTRYADLAFRYAQSQDSENAKKYYDLARKYLRTYNNTVFGTAGYYYKNIYKDYDKAIKIFSEQNNFSGLAECYILKNDYKTALSYAQKFLEKRSSNPYAYELLFAIYSNLGDNLQAQKSFENAQKLCKYTVCANRQKELYKNPKTFFENQNNSSLFSEYKIDGTRVKINNES